MKSAEAVRALGAGMDSIVKPHFIAESEKRVANWNHKPEIKARKFIKADSLSINVYPAGPNKKYWLWTSKGTKRHDIPSAGPGFLAFQLGYQPKTAKSGGGYGGPGIATGPWRSGVMQIDHPGTTPREFEKYILAENKQWFSRTMENLWRRTIRAL